LGLSDGQVRHRSHRRRGDFAERDLLSRGQMLPTGT
jgi:hypothetical protein